MGQATGEEIIDDEDKLVVLGARRVPSEFLRTTNMVPQKSYRAKLQSYKNRYQQMKSGNQQQNKNMYSSPAPQQPIQQQQNTLSKTQQKELEYMQQKQVEAEQALQEAQAAEAALKLEQEALAQAEQQANIIKLAAAEQVQQDIAEVTTGDSKGEISILSNTPTVYTASGYQPEFSNYGAENYKAPSYVNSGYNRETTITTTSIINRQATMATIPTKRNRTTRPP